MLNIIETHEQLQVLYEYLKDKDIVAFDTETTGLTKDSEIIGYSVCAEEDKAFYVILAKWSPEVNKLIYDNTLISESKKFMESLVDKKLVMHNSVFDCMMVESNFRVDLMPSVHTDTMILAHLIDENRKVGLKDLGTSMFGEDVTTEQVEMKESVLKNGGKLTVKDYELYKADASLIAKYGAKDALLTYKIFTRLVPQLFNQGLDKFFYEDESMPMLRNVTYGLNTTGLCVDTQKLATLKKLLEAECMEAKAYILKEIQHHVAAKYPGNKPKDTFNIGSPSQLAWLLFGELQIEYSYLTDAGKDVCKALGLRIPYHRSAKNDFIYACINRLGQEYAPGKKIREPWSYIACDKRTLEKIAPKYKWVETLLEYQKKMKLLSTYVEGIQDRMKYGVIYPSFLQHGTTSGRYSSRNPNFQNLPRDDKRIKECIIARPGKVFVGADYSQLEPRVFACISKDVRLLSAFEDGNDFYSVIGREVYDKLDTLPMKEGDKAFGELYPKLRQNSKVIALASTYGATPYQLAPMTKKSVEDTREDINSYFEKFPDVKNMMLESHTQAKTLGVVYNLFGRPRRIPEAKRINKLYGNADHEDLPYEARNILNLAVNHRIQSTAASIVNRAAIHFKAAIGNYDVRCQIVIQVHDSLVVECDYKDQAIVAQFLQDSMETAVLLPGIKLEAIPKIGENLAQV